MRNAAIWHNLSPSLTIRGVAVKQPGRSKMKKNLQGIQNAAVLIVNILNDGSTRDFLDAATPGKIPYHGQLDHMLRDLVRRTKVAHSWLVTENGKTKAGRNKAEPPGCVPPKTFCAAVVLEAWSFIHGAEPAPKNKEAAAAAELFWNVSLASVSIEPTKAALEISGHLGNVDSALVYPQLRNQNFDGKRRGPW
jgi:hypothetical protein